MVTKKITRTGYSGVTQNTASAGRVSRRRTHNQEVQNVQLVWLDSNIDHSNRDCQNTLVQLRRVDNDTIPFSDATECIQFIESINKKKICMIISGSLGQHIVPQVHGMSQVESIFIFCGNKQRHEQWAKEWPKITGVFTDIALICEALQKVSKQCEQDASPMSFVAPEDGALGKALNQLDPTFMYTEIMKKTSIWWYTRECFLNTMVNAAPRTMDGDAMIKMGFFINDLHHQIQELHVQQRTDYPVGKTFTVYRGQGLSKAIVEQLEKTEGGLMSFNNFLSTSKQPNVWMASANQALSDPESVGILFVMTIDPTQSTTPFASVNEVDFFGDEEDEVLFSMYSAFRINGIQQMSEHPRLFQVKLTLISDNDEDLRKLTARMDCKLLKMDQPKTAEEVFQGLRKKPGEESIKGAFYRFLEWTRVNQGQYQEALKLYEKSTTTYKRILLPNHFELVQSYNNIGLVYDNVGAY